MNARAQDQRLVLKSALAKLKQGQDLTEHEAHMVGLADAGFGPAEAMQRLAELCQNPPARNAMALVSALRTYIELVGANAPQQVEHDHSVRISIDGLRELAGGSRSAGALEAGSSGLLSGGAGVDALGEASPDHAGDSSLPPHERGNGRGGNGAPRG